jgi:hypothetical protein
MYDKDTGEYTNPYILLDETTVIYEAGDTEFRVADESVLMCLARSQEDGIIFPFYVSKEYNTSAEDGNGGSGHYHPGRFIFQGDPKSVLNIIALAEEAAKLFSGPTFNVERYYLDTKKKQDPGII